MKYLKTDLVQTCHDWAEATLKPTLLDRDQNVVFNSADWKAAQSLGLSTALKGNNTKQEVLELASMFYGLARGSMDLPFCSSLAAHSVIAMDLINNFCTPEQKEKYLPLMRDTNTIAAVCNSEDGAGTDLRKMTATAELSKEGTAVINFNKPCATNASHADLFLCSVWETGAGQKSSLAVFILEKNEVHSKSLQSSLSGFRTGLTGSVLAQNAVLNHKDRALKTTARGLNLFKRCFDMERLFLGIMVSGVLEGVETSMLDYIKQKENQGFNFQDKQYLQEKVIAVFAARTQISSLIEKIFSEAEFDLNKFSKELSLLKIMINTDAVAAITSFYEFVGHKGFRIDNICQKLARDFAGLKYFGGTTELQKNNLFTELSKSTEKRKLKLVA